MKDERMLRSTSLSRNDLYSFEKYAMTFITIAINYNIKLQRHYVLWV